MKSLNCVIFSNLKPAVFAQWGISDAPIRKCEWLGYVAGVAGTRFVYRVLVEKSWDRIWDLMQVGVCGQLVAFWMWAKSCGVGQEPEERGNKHRVPLND